MVDCIGREQFRKDYFCMPDRHEWNLTQSKGNFVKNYCDAGKFRGKSFEWWNVSKQENSLIYFSDPSIPFNSKNFLSSKEMELHPGNTLHNFPWYVEYLLRFGGFTTGLLTGSRHIRPHRCVEQHFCVPVQYWSAVHCPGHIPRWSVVGHKPWFDAAVCAKRIHTIQLRVENIK